MAYQGYLLKIGGNIIPLKYMRASTYQALRSGQDLDSYRDADGELHRTALEHFLYKVEFETPPLMTDVEMTKFLRLIQSQYIDVTETKVHMELYVPELNAYVEQDAYVPDIPFTIYYADSEKVQYEQTRVAFIGY